MYVLENALMFHGNKTSAVVTSNTSGKPPSEPQFRFGGKLLEI